MNIIQKDNMSLMQREDGYVNATALCKQAGEKIDRYFKSDETKEFLEELSREIGLPIKPSNFHDTPNGVSAENQGSRALLEIKKGGAGEQGTYIHPKVAIHLGQWLSPKFAVFVSNVVFDFMDGGETKPKLDPIKAFKRYHELTRQMTNTVEELLALQHESDIIFEGMIRENTLLKLR